MLVHALEIISFEDCCTYELFFPFARDGIARQRQLFLGNSWKRISFQIRDETNTIDRNERQRRRIINPSLGNRVIYFFKNMQK